MSLSDHPEQELLHPFDVWQDDGVPNIDNAHGYSLAIVAPPTKDSMDVMDAFSKAIEDNQSMTCRCDDLLRLCRLQAVPWSDPLILAHVQYLLQGNKFVPGLILYYGKWIYLCDGYHRYSTAYHLDPQQTVPVFWASID